MTLTEEMPVEYKVINSDGTVSKTIGNTVTAENVTATIATVQGAGESGLTGSAFPCWRNL